MLPHVQPEPRRRCLGYGYFPVALEWTGDWMWEACLGAAGVRTLNGTWGSPQHRNPNAGQRANKEPDCAVVVDTQLRMGSGIYVWIMPLK